MDLTREQMDDYQAPTTAVECPELGGTVYVRELDTDGVEQMAIESQAAAKGDEILRIRFLYRVAVLTISDVSGKRLYGNDETAAIKKWPFSALERVVEAALKLNKMDEESLAKAEAALSGPLAGSTRGSSKRKAARSKRPKPKRRPAG